MFSEVSLDCCCVLWYNNYNEIKVRRPVMKTCVIYRGRVRGTGIWIPENNRWFEGRVSALEAHTFLLNNTDFEDIRVDNVMVVQ